MACLMAQIIVNTMVLVWSRYLAYLWQRMDFSWNNSNCIDNFRKKCHMIIEQHIKWVVLDTDNAASNDNGPVCQMVSEYECFWCRLNATRWQQGAVDTHGATYWRTQAIWFGDKDSEFIVACWLCWWLCFSVKRSVPLKIHLSPNHIACVLQ